MGWWTDLAEKRGPVVNSGDGDGRPGEPADRLLEHRGLILHIADGYYEGTIAWQHNPAADVSSHFVVAGPRDVPRGTPDGKLAQCVDTDERAWTQQSGNISWLSIECSGFGGDALSPAQIEACAQIFARGHQVYGYPLQLATSPSGRGLGHHSMGAESGVDWGHSQCPGQPVKAQKPLIVARAIQIVQGGPPKEDDVTMYVIEVGGVPPTPDNPKGERVVASTGTEWWWVRNFGPLSARGIPFPTQRVTPKELRESFGVDKEATAGGGPGGLTYDEAVRAAEEGANRAEDS